MAWCPVCTEPTRGMLLRTPYVHICTCTCSIRRMGSRIRDELHKYEDCTHGLCYYMYVQYNNVVFTVHCSMIPSNRLGRYSSEE